MAVIEPWFFMVYLGTFVLFGPPPGVNNMNRLNKIVINFIYFHEMSYLRQGNQ